LEPVHGLEVELEERRVLSQRANESGPCVRVAPISHVDRDAGRAVLTAPRDDGQSEVVGRTRLDLERPQDDVPDAVAAEPERSSRHPLALREDIAQMGYDTEIAAPAAETPEQL